MSGGTFPCPASTVAPLDLRSAQLSGVYFIQQGETGPIKIGFSTSVRARLSTLQTATHERLWLLLVLPGEMEDEKRLHAWFARERLGGEWFRSGGEVSAFVAAQQERLAVVAGHESATASRRAWASNVYALADQLNERIHSLVPNASADPLLELVSLLFDESHRIGGDEG